MREALPFREMRRYIYRFLARNRLTIRRVTRNVVLNERELERRANEFLDEVLRILSDAPNTTFLNMDESWVYTNAMPRTTIDLVGVTSVAARVTRTPRTA